MSSELFGQCQQGVAQASDLSRSGDPRHRPQDCWQRRLAGGLRQADEPGPLPARPGPPPARAVNEAFLASNGFVSHIHRKKPKGRTMPEAIRRANNAKSKIRSRVEHVFAQQKCRMGLFIRSMKAWTTRNGLVHAIPELIRCMSVDLAAY
jgi:hypothetical protein